MVLLAQLTDTYEFINTSKQPTTGSRLLVKAHWSLLSQKPRTSAVGAAPLFQLLPIQDQVEQVEFFKYLSASARTFELF